MSERHYRLYLNDILESGHAIQLYVEGITYDIFCKERMRISAVVREFEIVSRCAMARS
ncbi:HepT-like ribonuclease domain-containing protein [Desulfocastanea catecholica]